jgi:hypothetical protein
VSYAFDMSNNISAAYSLFRIASALNPSIPINMSVVDFPFLAVHGFLYVDMNNLFDFTISRKKESRQQHQSETDEETNDSEILATTTSEVMKSLWNQLEPDGVTTNLIPNGIVKNKKRMRFQTKTISLENESD